MKVSINWLNEWIEVADLDPRELAERLTMAGLEVDAIEEIGAGADDIVVAEIVAIEEHPNADRLVICTVDAGNESPHTVVCGATNMGVGDRVPLAKPGANPPGIDFEIGARKVMGIQSEGMLCSAEELDLADESAGLMILDNEALLGTPVFDALGVRDVILEIDLTPNRADCLSHLGVAREVAALYDRPLKDGRHQVAAIDELTTGDGEQKTAEVASLTVDDRQGCPQYGLAVVDGIEVTESPQWLRHRLAAVGLRAVNSVVDVTNYVLMDVGQPLHAFDLDCLDGQQIIVRRAADGETLRGIDHDEYELSTEDLVIADGAGPVAIAGVMGGAESEVSEKTSRILLEVASFDPTTVRKSAKRHSLHTDASHRFERGTDAGAIESSMAQALALLVSVQQEAGQPTPKVYAEPLKEGKSPQSGATIELDSRRVSSLLGIDVDDAQCAQLLSSIGVDVSTNASPLVCTAPTYRRDLTRPVDLVEEVARLFGYDNIPTTMPRLASGQRHRHRRDSGEKTVVSRRERGELAWLRHHLLSQGLMEAINYSFMGAQDLERLELEEDDRRRQAAKVANPLVADQGLMRTTLVPSLLNNAMTNFAKSRRDVALFEVGRRYFPDREVRTLGIVVTGQRQVHWSGKRAWDFYDLKGLVETAATPWDTSGSQWQRPEKPEPYLHPGVQACWYSGDRLLGTVGQLHPAVAQAEGIEQPLFLAEIDLEALIAGGVRQDEPQEAPKFPAVVRDFALLYDEDRLFAQLEEAVMQLVAEDREFASRFEGLELFDVYEGRQVPEGKRSLAIKVTYRRDDRTLEEAEIESADRQLLSHLKENVGAQLRGN